MTMLDGLFRLLRRRDREHEQRHRKIEREIEALDKDLRESEFRIDLLEEEKRIKGRRYGRRHDRPD